MLPRGIDEECKGPTIEIKALFDDSIMLLLLAQYPSYMPSTYAMVVVDLAVSLFGKSAISLEVTLAEIDEHATVWASRARILLVVLVLVAFASTTIFAALIAELVAACAPVIRTKLAASPARVGSAGPSDLRHVFAAIDAFDHVPTFATLSPALRRSRVK